VIVLFVNRELIGKFLGVVCTNIIADSCSYHDSHCDIQP